MDNIPDRVRALIEASGLGRGDFARRIALYSADEIPLYSRQVRIQAADRDRARRGRQGSRRA